MSSRDAVPRVRERVAAAERNGEHRLPSERALARELGLSRGTIRSALSELEEQGLVQAKPQSGWILTGSAISEPRDHLMGFTEMAQLHGYRPSSRVLASRSRVATEDEATRLNGRGWLKVWELDRLRFLEERPISREVLVLPQSVASDLIGVDMTNRSLLVELEKRGVWLARTDVTVTAAAAPEGLATLLEVTAGSPLLGQQETGFDQFGSPIFIGAAHYRGDSYRFRSSLTRRMPQHPTSRGGSLPG